jgi:hypothetical protein
MDPVRTPVDHDPFATPKEGKTVPYEPVRQPTDYPAVRSAGVNLVGATQFKLTPVEDDPFQ